MAGIATKEQERKALEQIKKIVAGLGEDSYVAAAEMFCAAIKELASKPENLDNLECYLTHHFDWWMQKMAGTPLDLATEMHQFAIMEL